GVGPGAPHQVLQLEQLFAQLVELVASLPLRDRVGMAGGNLVELDLPRCVEAMNLHRLLCGRAALLEGQVALLVLLSRPTRAGVVAADARPGAQVGGGRVLHDGAALPARRRGRLAMRLDGLLLPALWKRRQ